MCGVGGWGGGRQRRFSVEIKLGGGGGGQMSMFPWFILL